MCRFNNCGGNFGGGLNNGLTNSLARHMMEFLGETVIVFTESGGASGCGFEGILLNVNNDLVRIRSNNNGNISPSNPLSETICGSFGEDNLVSGFEAQNCGRKKCHQNFGAITDIPIRQIVAFTHNAI